MFAAGRAFEQVRNSIGYPHLNVKIGATHAGISVGEDGASHQCCEDVALMRKTVDEKTSALEKETGKTWKRVQVKASGGIRDKATAKAMIEAGAQRLGTSATVDIVTTE